MSRPSRVRPPTLYVKRPTLSPPWRGLGGLFSLSVIVGPMALLESPLPSILDGNALVPLGVVIALIIAVFRAGQQMQKLTDKLQLLDKLQDRLAVLEDKVETLSRHCPLLEQAAE